MSDAVTSRADRTSGLRVLRKITPPVHARITPNTRLHARVDAVRDRPIVWIHGLPGAGKTSLIASWLGARGIVPLWYRIDDGDADPASLFVFLRQAATASNAKIEPDLPSWTPQHAPPAFARLFFQALFSHATTTVLVYDDYHEIDAGSQVHALLASGFAQVPQGVTVFVISRAGPPPAFARLRANGQLAVISPDELRLTRDEARAIIRDRATSVPASTLDAIVARTHGWIAGLVLILEALESDAGSLDYSGTLVPEVVFDYFAGEVFRRMERAEQDHLLSLAVLPAMNAASAARLTGSVEAARTLERLTRRSYFTTRDAQENPNYCFHPLFRDFLRKTAREIWPADRLDAIRHHAAEILEEACQPEEAIPLLVEAGDWPNLIAIILRWAPVLEREGRIQTVSGWLDRLPPGAVAAHGWLSFWAGSARMGVRPPESRPHFDRARVLFEQEGDQRGLLLSWASSVDSIRYDLFASSSLYDTLFSEFEVILARDPSYPSPEVEVRVVNAMYAALERRRPDHPELQVWRARTLALARAHPQGGRLELACFGMAIYDLMAGRFASARKCFDELPDPSMLGANPFGQQIGYFVKAYLQAELYLHGSPRETVQAALDGALRTGTTYFLHLILAMAAHDAQHYRDLAGSEHWMATIRRLMPPEYLRRSAHHHLVLTQHDLVAGQIDSARRHAETGVDLAVAMGWDFQEAWSRLNLADILRHSGDLIGYQRQLDAAGANTARGGLISIEFVRLLHVANLQILRGGAREGHAALEKAFRYGRRIDVRRLYRIPLSAPLVCARALAAGIEVEYVRKLIWLNRIPCPEPDLETWPWPLKIVTFGGLAVLKDDAPLRFGRKTPRRLIELLKAIVAFGGSDVPEARIIDALWPEEEGDASRQSFTVAVHRLRKLLGDTRFVQVSGGRVSLNPELCWLDVWSFERLLGAAGPTDAKQRRERALALYRGAFLADDEDLPWTAPRREHLHRRYARARSDLA